jgi:Set1/Ash2 histone methyltransferase complex subunit ASH2
MAECEVPATITQDAKRKDTDLDPSALLRRSKKGKKKARPADVLPDVLVAPLDCIHIVPTSKEDDASQGSDSTVQLSSKDKAQQMQLSPDGLAVTASKGYRTVRATHGVYTGTWYCEVNVQHLGATGHCRLGWCTKKAELQAPVGFDKCGFSYRDVDGSKVHESWRTDYGSPYKEGDVIGMLIHLPAGGKPMEKVHKEHVKYKGAMYVVDSADPEPQPLPGSFVGFFLNGVWQGKAFADFSEGTYYPAASLYTLPQQTEGATVAFNFSPQAPPPVQDAAGQVLPAARPFCEVGKESAAATAAAAAGITAAIPPMAPCAEGGGI